jgi:hypothetical protein
MSLWRLHESDAVWRHIGSEGHQPGQFFNPQAVAVTRAGTLLVADEHRVQELALDGTVLCVVGSHAIFGQRLFGIAACPVSGDVVVADYDHNHVVVLGVCKLFFFFFFFFFFLN